jgi:hypothetical protein
MAATEPPSAVDLVRTASQSSSKSISRKSSTVRVRPSKRSSNASLARSASPAADTKSLTSFPSLSPTSDSPVQSRANGWLRNALGAGDGGNKIGENKLANTSSPESTKTIAAPEPTSNPTSGSTVRKVTKSTQQIVGSLVAVAAATRDRSALFDDTPSEPTNVPGNLHYATDENIQEMLAQTGGVVMVRQLAGDLAQRDTQITALRRRTEERERILRKMLQECEVSNMDIENRLRELEKSQEQQNGENDWVKKPRRKGTENELPGMHPEDPMHQRLARAMEDELAEFPDALGFDSGSTVPSADRESINSTLDVPREMGQGNWKSFLWNGTSKKSSRAPSIASVIDRDSESSAQSRSRASSGAKPPRKPISNDLFVPPAGADNTGGAIPTLRRLQSQDQVKSSASSRRKSMSIGNWALKMVAGNNQAAKSNTTRGRKNVSSDPTDREASRDSTNTTHSSKSALANAQKRGGRTLGPNGTIKSIISEPTKNTPVNSPLLPARGVSNLGPVEMDRILPEESRPPTLVQQHNRFATSNEYLTDRFGFIYDQRRKKRQNEAAAALTKQTQNSNVESLGGARSTFKGKSFNEHSENNKSYPSDPDGTSRPRSRPGSISSGERGAEQTGTKWADYLKLATHPTELLSHTPSAAPITSVESAEAEITAPKINQISLVKRGTMPSSSTAPEPSPSRIVSSNAEFSVTVPSPGMIMPISFHSQQPDPVQSLLEHMTGLHDSLQSAKTVKWNEFLRKVRAERRREGESSSTGEGQTKGLAMPETLLTDGEIIGTAGLGLKGKVGRAKWLEFRKLVLGGIPVAYRASIWAECSGASALRVPGYYEDLVLNGDDNPTIVTQIQMDITRTLTDNIFFRKGPGVHKLNEVLLAYSRRNTEVGYCQGMNLIAACLLLIMPTSEDAFWALATMIEDILPEKYYDQHLLTSRADQSVLREYVADLLPKLSNHLDMLEIELEALTFQWFLSVFTDCLSAEALYRVWDVVLCLHDGATFLFQVALALLKLNEKALLQCETPSEIYHYINHQMTNHAISIDGLIQASDALNKVVKRKDVEERREKAVAREQEVMRQREELRLERSRKRTMKDNSMTTQEEEGKAPSISASLDAEISMQTSPMRTPLSNASVKSEEEEDVGYLNQSLEELTNRTPMPIEEESLWRA